MRKGGLYSVEGLFREETKRVKKRKKVKATLSFAMEDVEDEGDNSSRQTPEDDNGEQVSKRAKFRKNPNVDTSFLPDRDREESERKERERLRQEWIRRQEELKQEEIEITYSYWDGSGHRKSAVVCSSHASIVQALKRGMLQCKKGDTVSAFLEKCRQQFPELRGVSVDNLMYIKEDLIIPHVSSW
jgi:protein FAM50